MGAARIIVDADELERIASEVVREVPAHLVASEIRKRTAERVEKQKKALSPAALARAQSVIDDLVRRKKR